MSRPSHEPEILRLHATGMTGAAIARQLGCSAPCVSQTLKRHGLGRDHSPHRVDKARPSKPEPEKAEKPGIDPKRADKRLRRFSWEAQA